MSSKLDIDSIKNTCTGTGSLKIRVSNKQEADKIMRDAFKIGYGV